MLTQMTIPQALQEAVQHHHAGRLHEAEQLYRAVLTQNPNQVDALNLLGVIADHFGHHEAAVELIGRAAGIMPGEAVIKVNLAFALANLARVEESLAILRSAIAIQPLLPLDAYQNLASLLLVTGRFTEGWPYFERYRDELGLTAPGKVFAQPKWRGEDLAGKTILIYTEQGLGDVIQFVRYALLLGRAGARVLIGCPPPLERLLRGCPELGQVVPSGASPPSFDYHCPILSLPGVFGTELHSVPAEIPYIHPEPQLVEEWAARLGPPDGWLRVGLIWAGRPEHENDRRRSITLAALAPLGKVEGVRFYSLQKGPAADQARHPPAGMELIDLTADLTDLAHTAAMMSHLDLVIGVDTGPMHLAGATGRPAWVMLPLFPDFRWLMNREDSPWYPTMRLFRQTQPGQWADVIESVASALRDHWAGRFSS
jgi:hypothetical protein